MKLIYDAPKMEIVTISAEDIITTSTLTDGGPGQGETTPWPGSVTNG